MVITGSRQLPPGRAAALALSCGLRLPGARTTRDRAGHGASASARGRRRPSYIEELTQRPLPVGPKYDLSSWPTGHRDRVGPGPSGPPQPLNLATVTECSVQVGLGLGHDGGSPITAGH